MKYNLKHLSLDRKLYLYLNGNKEKEVITSLYDLDKSDIRKESEEYKSIMDAIYQGANAIHVYYIDKLHEPFISSINLSELLKQEKREIALELFKVMKYRQSDIAVILGMSTSGVNRLITKNK